ncbi:uncharacterized protein TNCV_2360641 [Trichonephila clavipes]|nr:uncharacterized protein TNCV_2360641 [Trichonephila clavipes]
MRNVFPQDAGLYQQDNAKCHIAGSAGSKSTKSECWTLSKAEEEKLLIFERKIIRVIFGSIQGGKYDKFGHCIYFIYLSNAHAWLLDHLTPMLPVPTDDVISRVFIESSVLEQVVAIHSGMAAEWAGLVSSYAKPMEVSSQKVMSGS